MNVDVPREAVVLLHGLWMNRLAMIYLARSLGRCGFAPHSVNYRSMRGALEENVATVGRRIAALRADTVHLVGHSLGGVVALRYLQGAPDARIGRTVLLGAPLAGSRAAVAFARHPAGRLLLGTSLALWRSNFDTRLDPRLCVGAIAGARPFGLAHSAMRLPGECDGVILVEETRSPMLADHLVLPVSHSGMLVSARVARQVALFLSEGRFGR